jgi:hypothetical protein
MKKQCCLIIFLLTCFVCNSQGQISIKTKKTKGDNADSNQTVVSGLNPPQRLDSETVYAGTGDPYFMNTKSLNGKTVERVYSETDSAHVYFYASFDSSSDLEKFKTLGLSITLLIFSIYLFHVSTKIYRQYFEKTANEDFFTFVFFGSVVLFNVLWVIITLELKGIPFSFIKDEFLHYPNQFVLGVLLSSLLLFSVGIFRFTLIAFIPNSNNTEKTLTDSRFSFVGLIFGVVSAIANIATIWQAFK